MCQFCYSWICQLNIFSIRKPRSFTLSEKEPTGDLPTCKFEWFSPSTFEMGLFADMYGITGWMLVWWRHRFHFSMQRYTQIEILLERFVESNFNFIVISFNIQYLIKFHFRKLMEVWSWFFDTQARISKLKKIKISKKIKI